MTSKPCYVPVWVIGGNGNTYKCPTPTYQFPYKEDFFSLPYLKVEVNYIPRKAKGSYNHHGCPIYTRINNNGCPLDTHLLATFLTFLLTFYRLPSPQQPLNISPNFPHPLHSHSQPSLLPLSPSKVPPHRTPPPLLPPVPHTLLHFLTPNVKLQQGSTLRPRFRPVTLILLRSSSAPPHTPRDIPCRVAGDFKKLLL